LIEPGTRAPDFSLPDQNGEQVALSDLRGDRVLLAFYPLDFSEVCTDQLSVYQEVLGEIEATGTKLLGISVDHAYAHKAFGEKNGLSMPLLADFHPKGEVASAYGAYLPKWGTSNRSLVLIDADGVVEWVYEAPTPLKFPGANVIFDALAE